MQNNFLATLYRLLNTDVPPGETATHLYLRGVAPASLNYRLAKVFEPAPKRRHLSPGDTRAVAMDIDQQFVKQKVKNDRERPARRQTPATHFHPI
jgi:hypothetical protein